MTKKNYKYGKLVDGKLVYAPNKLKTTIEDKDGNHVLAQMFNAPQEKYMEQGYFPIIKAIAPAPTDNGYYVPEYRKVGDTIVESYSLVPYTSEGEDI